MRLYIFPIHFIDQDLLLNISNTLKEVFGFPVAILEHNFPLSETEDPFRNQYNSTLILSQLIRYAPEESCKILGITSLDLFAPVLSYVFGSARLNGNTAIVSTYRLRDELYNLPGNPERLRDRLEKVAIHELGHTFGLVHCRSPRCVMFSTTYAEEIDFKLKNFCKVCSTLLDKNMKQSH